MQQMDIFDVFEEQDDLEIVRKRLAALQPSQNIITKSVEVRMLEKFIEVNALIFAMNSSTAKKMP